MHKLYVFWYLNVFGPKRLIPRQTACPILRISIFEDKPRLSFGPRAVSAGPCAEVWFVDEVAVFLVYLTFKLTFLIPFMFAGSIS